MKKQIEVKSVKVHNLKSVDIVLPHKELIVFTGVSGSGKTSMAFDTLFVEGQRRFIESLPSSMKRGLLDFSKPDIAFIRGLTPTLSIEQQKAHVNPRSTVGTLTEIYDYFRVLFAKVGVPHCPVSKKAVSPQSKEKIIQTIQNMAPSTKIHIYAPCVRGKKGQFHDFFEDLRRRGFTRVRVDGTVYSLDELPPLDKKVQHDVDLFFDRITVEKSAYTRIAEAVIQALDFGKGQCIVIKDDGEEILYSIFAYSAASKTYYPLLEPQDFSYNTFSGMCTSCHGLGEREEFVLEKILDPNKSIQEGCCLVAGSYHTVYWGNIYRNLARIYGVKDSVPWKKIPPKAQNIFLHGTEQKWTKMLFTHPTSGARWIEYVRWRGILFEAYKRYQKAKSESYKKNMREFMKKDICSSCHGAKIKPYPAACKLKGKTISEITQMSITKLFSFMQSLSWSEEERQIADQPIDEIRKRLEFLEKVGLHYLTLDRKAHTLSGGEAQRLRLASQIGSPLVGLTYILDEPTIGLHQTDNEKLIESLCHLRDKGNTVIVVEHDKDMILAADRIVDFGPGAGYLGGKIVVNGDKEDLYSCQNSLTADYLTEKKQICPLKNKRKIRGHLEVIGAKQNNLKNINVSIPLGVFVVISGVSGSGKSSLIMDILYPALANRLHRATLEEGVYEKLKGIEKIDKVISIDQSPIGRNPRSNPATYIKLFEDIRDLFCKLPQSQARGFKPSRFSFNVREGTCLRCRGRGTLQVDRDFLEEVSMVCPQCKGKRFEEDTLAITYKGKNIFDVLEMEIKEALEIFQNIPSIQHKLEMLKKVGLSYLKLGQPSTTLSGGEAQRIKLAKELVRPSTRKTLYILDEPTTGLHFHDMNNLLNVLHELVDKGNTVVVIEHNMEVIKTADWIIDLGPKGGEQGGKIVGKGDQKAIMSLKTLTAKALKQDQRKSKKQYQCIKKETLPSKDLIQVRGAFQNNLKNIDVDIPRGSWVIFCGPSGSGKSSLALDILHSEGQRKYLDSFSSYAKQFFKIGVKPKVETITNISPTVAIEKKRWVGSSRSTVGTITEIYDYLRVLYAQKGIPHCPQTKKRIRTISVEFVVNEILKFSEGEKIQILAPIQGPKSEGLDEWLSRIETKGFVRIRLNNTFYEIDDEQLKKDFHPKEENKFFLVIDRLIRKSGMEQRLYEAVRIASEIGNKKMVIMRGKEELFFNLAFSVDHASFHEITPHTFSFNSTEGMCPTCLGLGYEHGIELSDHPALLQLTPIKLLKYFCRMNWNDEVEQFFLKWLELREIENIPLKKLCAKKVSILMNGEKNGFIYEGSHFRWIGINAFLGMVFKSAKKSCKDGLFFIWKEIVCSQCKGKRLNLLAQHVTIHKVSICDILQMPISEVLQFVETIVLEESEKIALEEVLLQIKKRLRFIMEVGLEYLCLDRRSNTLSSGEMQRINLARHLGCGMSEIIYILDEPTIGLHPFNIRLLHQAFSALKKENNTIICIEHDLRTISKADYVFDFGPKAGVEGGSIVAQGIPKEIKKDHKSLTGAYLQGTKKISMPSKRRKILKSGLEIYNACKHNLDHLSVMIPSKVLTCVTGVSGSGKSTLIQEVLLPAVERGIKLRQDEITVDNMGTVKNISLVKEVISLNQQLAGQNVRSDVCTYMDLFDHLRRFFAELPLAKKRGLTPSHFSYNHRKGMCTSCYGLGYKIVNMHFMSSVEICCDQCKGLRLNPLSLEVVYHGKNLGEFLLMTLEEIYPIFSFHPKIEKILKILFSLGLHYLQLGQEITKVSSGEVQRMRLAKELLKKKKGQTLYLLDEPTVGLHAEDIKKILAIMHELVDKGNTVVIVEHNMDVVKQADYIIDIGPDAGAKGGRLMFCGKPEEFVNKCDSKTAYFLNKEF